MNQALHYRDQLRLIASELEAAGHGEKSRVATHHAEMLGMKVSTLYRALKREAGWCSGRKVRADKGSTGVAEESLAFVAALQKPSHRANGKQTMFTPLAASVADRFGYDIDVSAKQVQRLLKARGLDAETQARATPHVSMRSLHPNHVHMVDPSLCLMFYAPDGRLTEIREDVAYKNKPDEMLKVKNKLWRYVLVDHYSHWICVKYYEARGETQDSLFHFLMHCWQQQPGRTFHGVPKMLMMDPGSANTAHAIKNLCAALEVELQINTPGQPRAKGSVEVAQNIVETQFEALLKFQPVSSVAELNEAAAAWCMAYNANMIEGQDTRLTRVGAPQKLVRNDVWLTIKADVLRPCLTTDACATLMRGVMKEVRVKADLTIRYLHPRVQTTRTYDVRNVLELRVGDTVTVRPLLYTDGEIIIEFELFAGQKRTHRLESAREYDPVSGFPMDAPIIGEEYKALPEHDDQKAGKALDFAAYGIDADGVIRTPEEIEKAKKDAKIKPFAHLNDGQGLKPLDALKGIELPQYLPKKGTKVVPKIAPLAPLRSTAMEKDGGALCVPSIVSMAEADTKLKHIEMAKRLRVALDGDWNTALYEDMVNLYPEGVTYEEMPIVIDRFKALTGRSGLRVVK